MLRKYTLITLSLLALNAQSAFGSDSVGKNISDKITHAYKMASGGSFKVYNHDVWLENTGKSIEVMIWGEAELRDSNKLIELADKSAPRASIGLKTQILLAIEAKKIKNKTPFAPFYNGHDKPEKNPAFIQIDEYTKCQRPVYYGESLIGGWIRCKTTKDLE